MKRLCRRTSHSSRATTKLKPRACQFEDILQECIHKGLWNAAISKNISIFTEASFKVYGELALLPTGHTTVNTLFHKVPSHLSVNMRPMSFLTIASVAATASTSALNLPVSDPIPICLPSSVPTGGASPSLPVSETSVPGIGASPSLPVSVTSVPGIGASSSLPVSVPSVPSTTGAPSVPAVPTDLTELLANIQSAIQILEVVTALLNNQDLQIPELGSIGVDSALITTLLATVESLLKVLGSFLGHLWEHPERGLGLAL